MAWAETQVAGWQEKILIVKELTSAFGTEVTPYTNILPVTNDLQIKKNKEQIDFGMRHRGLAYKQAEDFAQGRQKPAFEINTPMRMSSFKWLLTLFMQKFTESGSGPFTDTFSVYDTATAKYGMSTKKIRGATVAEGEKASGCVATGLTQSFGVDGAVTLAAPMIALTAAKNNAAPAGSETELADSILTMEDFTCEINGTPVNLVSAEIAMVNNAAHVPRAGESAEAISLGIFDITGNFKVYWYGNSGLRDDFHADTAKQFELLAGTPAAADEISEIFDLKFTDVDVKEEENISMATCSFKQAENGNAPQIVVGGAASWPWP